MILGFIFFNAQNKNTNIEQTIKSLLSFMIYVVYNSKLEQSFVMDKYADFSLKNSKLLLPTYLANASEN